MRIICRIAAVAFSVMMPSISLAADSGIDTLKAWASKGDLAAQRSLGMLYLVGDKVPRNLPEGLRLLKSAASLGDLDAELTLGALYCNGNLLGVTLDYSEAKKWYRLAADRNSANAQGHLGAMYYFGMGVPKDYLVAGHWYTLAAESGDFSAQEGLGSMYLNGLGFAHDPIEGYKWLLIAHATASEAVSGKSQNPESSTSVESADLTMSETVLKDNTSFLSQGQIDEANRRATAWWTIHEK